MSERDDRVESLRQQVELLQSTIGVYEGMAAKVRAAAADAGWTGADDFGAMLQAIRARGRCEAADATREAARGIVKKEGDRWINFYIASSDEREKEIHAALMRVLRLLREGIEAIQRPDLPWQVSPDD